MVVQVQPLLEQVGAVFVALVGPDVRPFFEERAVEALHLAIGLRPEGTSEDLPDAEQGGGFTKEVGSAVDEGVVSHDALDDGAPGSEEVSGAHQECRTGVSALVGMNLGVGQTAVIVDRRVHVVVATSGAVAPRLPTEDPPATARRNAPQLLHIDMNQLAWSRSFIAADHLAGGPIHPVQALQSVPAEHRVARGAGHAEDPRQPMRTELALTAQEQDPFLCARRETARTVQRTAASIPEARLALTPVARQPLVDRRSRDPGSFSSSGRRPPFPQDSRDQQTPAKVVEPRTSMGHRESSSVVRP